MHSNQDNKITAGDTMAVNAVQHIDEGQRQSGQVSWGSEEGKRAPVDIESTSTAPVNMVQRIEGEDMQQQDMGHKGLMGKMKDATRRLKDKVKGRVSHGKDKDTDDYVSVSDNKSNTAADAVYSQHANATTAFTGGSDSHGLQPDMQYAGESGYEGESGHVYGETASELQRPGHFFVAGMPLSGDVQKGESPCAPSHGIPHTVSAPPTPVDDLRDYSSTESIDGSTGGFGAVAKPGKTDLDSSTSPLNYGPSQYSSFGGEGMGSALQREGDVDLNPTQSAPAAGHASKDLLGDVDKSGLLSEVHKNQQKQGPAVGQSEGSYTGYNPRGVEDEMSIQGMNATKLGSGYGGGLTQPGGAHTGDDGKSGVYNPPGSESAPASKAGWGVTAAKDAVIGSTATAMSKASGVTSMLAQKVGLGQQRTDPGMTDDTGVVDVARDVERFEGEGGKSQSEGHVSMGEKVKSQPEGYLSAATRKIGEGKDAVAQRLGYGGGLQQQMGVVDNQREMAVHDKEGGDPQSEGYLSSVTRTLGDGKDLVAERLGYGIRNQMGQQPNTNEVVVNDSGVEEGKKSGGGVMGAVSGTIGAVTGTVGGVKDSVLRNLGYGEDQKMVDKEEGENKGLTVGANRGMTGGELNSSSTPSSGGTWTDSAYGMASNVAGIATKAKDVVVEKVGMGKGNDGGELRGMDVQQEGMRVSGGDCIAQQESGQKEGQGLMKSMYDTVGKTAGAVKGAMANRIGYGATEGDTVVTEEGTTLPSGYGKVREDLSDLTIGEKAGGKVADKNRSTEAAKHAVPASGNYHGVV